MCCSHDCCQSQQLDQHWVHMAQSPLLLRGFCHRRKVDKRPRAQLTKVPPHITAVILASWSICLPLAAGGQGSKLSGEISPQPSQHDLTKVKQCLLLVKVTLPKQGTDLLEHVMHVNIFKFYGSACTQKVVPLRCV